MSELCTHLDQVAPGELPAAVAGAAVTAGVGAERCLGRSTLTFLVRTHPPIGKS
jgi:hypothetical protein